MRSFISCNSFMSFSKLSLSRIPLVLCTLVLVSSCGLLSKRQAPSDQQEQSNQMIPLQKHQELEQRYNELAKRYELLQREMGEGGVSSASSTENEAAQIQADLAETVDVFANQQQETAGPKEEKVSSRENKATKPRLNSSELDSDLIEEQIEALRKIEGLVSENRFDQGLTEIKKIEDSPVAQVRVRAKFFLGEILFKQGEYDLAMQIYEEIIQENAFSGVVIKTLGRLIVCSENLKLDKKRDTYYSILHDFFERG